MARIDRKMVLRWALWGGGALSALILCAGLLFSSGIGRNLVVSTLLKAIAGDGTAKVTRSGGDWPESLSLEGVEIADAQGPWLTIGRLDLTWRPLALLGGRLSIAKLAIDKPVLLRTPASSTSSASSSSSSWGSRLDLPVDVALDNLSITGGVLRGPDDIAFVGTGRALLDRRNLDVLLSLARQGGADEHVRLEARLDRRNHALLLDLDALGAAQGLFARLAGDPGLPAFRLKAKGQGPAAQWGFEAQGAAGAYGEIALKGLLSWSDRLVLELQGGVRPGSDAPLTLREFLGERGKLMVHYANEKGGDDATLLLSGAGGDVRVSAKAAAAGLLGARSLSGTVQLSTAKPLALDPQGTTLGAARIEGALGGTLAAPRLVLTLSAQSFDAAPYGVTGIAGKLDLGLRGMGAAQQLLAKGQGTIGDISANGATVTGAARWTLEGETHLATGAIEKAKLALTSTPLSLSATGEYGAKGGIAADLVLNAAALSALTPLVDVALDGRGTAHVALNRTASGEEIDAKIEARIEQGVIAGQDLAVLAGPALALKAVLKQAPDGALHLAQSELTGDHLTLTSQGQLLPALDAQSELKSDLGAVGALAGVSASGDLSGRIEAKGRLAQPRLTISLGSPSADLEGRKIGALALALTPSGEAPFPAGRVTLNAKGEAGIADLVVPVVRSSEGLVVGPLSGVAYGAQLTGRLRQTRGDWSGRIEATLLGLGPLHGLVTGAPQPVAGRGRLTVELSDKNGLKAGLVLREVMAGDRSFAAKSVNLDAARRGDTASLALKALELRLPGLAGPIDTRSVMLDVKGPERKLAWSLAIDGLMGARGDLRGDGQIETTAQGRRVMLGALNGNLYETALALEAPGALTLRPDGTTLDPLSLKIGNGRLGLSYLGKGKGQKGDVVLSALPLAFVGRLVNADWPQGRITGRIGLDTVAARPSGFVDVSFSDALFTSHAVSKASPLSGQINGRWNGHALSLKGNASRTPGSADEIVTPLSLEGQLPLTRFGDGHIGFDPKGPVSGELHWNGHLGTLWALLPYDLHRLDGAAVVHGKAAGRWGAPRLDGTLKVTEGRYESVATGTRLTDLVIDARAGPAGADLTLEGQDGRGGRMSGNGHLEFGETGRIEARLSLQKLRVVGLDRLTAIASGEVRLSGTMRAPLAKGALTLDQVDGSIPDRLPPSIPQLQVVRLGDYGGGPPEELRNPAPKDAAGQALALDISVDIPGRAFLRGRGITSEWRGKVGVEGDTVVPRIKGALELVRGDLAFGGRSYPLSRGRVVFDGSANTDPYLDIATQRTVGAVQVSLTVSGLASAPKLDITASPDRPKDEAMALFLFGKPAGSLTTLELLDVARSVATLTGAGGGGFDPIEKTRRALGLDVLTVGVGEKNGNSGTAADVASSASVAAGRYVTDKVYLGVKQGARADSSALQLNYALTPHISVGTEAGPATGGAFSLNWAWDY